jgi:hypothetical protein
MRSPLEHGLRAAVADFAGGKAEDALPIFIGATGDPVLGQYARLFADAPTWHWRGPRTFPESSPGS